MNCEAAREAISALLDGEQPAVESSEPQPHLVRCAACRAWHEDAHALTHRTLLAAAGAVPAPDASLLAVLDADSRSPDRLLAFAGRVLPLPVPRLAPLDEGKGASEPLRGRRAEGG